MKAIVGFALVSLVGCWLGPPAAFATDPSTAPVAGSSQSIKVELMRIDSESYIVKDESGKERRLHVGKDTEMYGQIKPGDLIEVWIQPDGHARTIMIVKSAPAAAN
jgi:hypothetical protein